MMIATLTTSAVLCLPRETAIGILHELHFRPLARIPANACVSHRTLSLRHTWNSTSQKCFYQGKTTDKVKRVKRIAIYCYILLCIAHATHNHLYDFAQKVSEHMAGNSRCTGDPPTQATQPEVQPRDPKTIDGNPSLRIRELSG